MITEGKVYNIKYKSGVHALAIGPVDDDGWVMTLLVLSPDQTHGPRMAGKDRRDLSMRFGDIRPIEAHVRDTPPDEESLNHLMHLVFVAD